MSSQYENNEIIDEYEDDGISPNQLIQRQVSEAVRASVLQENKVIHAVEQVNESTQQQVQQAKQKSVFADAKQPPVWEINDMTSNGPLRGFNIYNAFIQNNPYQYTFYGETVANRWKENFQYILGPTNPAFVDATLSDRDIAWGYCLEYNPNGILWRVSAAGLPHPDDYDNFIEQNRVIEEATNRTMEANISQTASASMLMEKGAEKNRHSRTREESQTIAVQTDNELIRISSEKFLKMYPNAIYSDGIISKLNWSSIRATPSGFTTLMKTPNYFYSHSADFSQAFDYVTLTLGYKFGQVSITRDCFGEWYISGGLTGSFLFGNLSTPIGVSIVGGYLQNVDHSSPDLLRDTLHNFIPGKSNNVAVGVLGTIGETQSGETKAMEIGFGTPTISVSESWTDDIMDIIKKYFYQK